MILRRSLVSFWLTRPVTRQCRWEACSSLRLSDDKQEGCCIWKCGKILKKTVSCCDFFICILSFCTYPHQLFRRMQLQQTWVCLFSHLTVNASKDSSTVTTDLTNTWRFYAPVNRITSTITLWACVWRETTAKQQKLRQKEHFVSSKRQNWYWKWNAHNLGILHSNHWHTYPHSKVKKVQGLRPPRTWKPVLCQKESVLLLCLYLLSLLVFRIPRGDSDVMG